MRPAYRSVLFCLTAKGAVSKSHRTGFGVPLFVRKYHTAFLACAARSENQAIESCLAFVHVSRRGEVYENIPKISLSRGIRRQMDEIIFISEAGII
mmetsp:Transcript_117579/g.186091  ORF Transcript_117579/g.186091 Transcript_117579/m.186091 type:complete len:96 (-) Transcript_117579:75-362(-)